MSPKLLGRLVAGSLALLCMLTVSGCEAGEDSKPHDHIKIAGGSTTGVYYNYGLYLAKALGARLEPEFEVTVTDGSVDNLQRIGRGEALMGFAQSDAAADADAGFGPFKERIPIQAIGRLYDEYVHVVVRADSDIYDLADFAGRSVSLGPKESGVNVAATRVLQASGVDLKGVANPALPLDEAIDALRDSRIDGFFWVGGLPTPGIELLAGEIDIRMLSIGDQTVERLNGVHAGVYRTAEFPARTYGSEEATVTMTVPTFLVVSESASPEFVYEVTSILFDARPEMAKHVSTAALLDRRQAIFTAPVNLHRGAEEYYRETRR